MTFCFVNWAFIIKTNMGRVYYIGQGIVLALWALVDSSSRGPLLMLLVCTISYVYVAKATDRKARRGHAAAGEVESIGASPSLSEEHGNISSTVGPVSAESDATESVAGWSLYNTDFYAWTQQQAALLHDEKWQHVDTFNVMWEIKRLSLDQRNEINGRLRELVMQLLKWRYQPEIREPYYSVNNGCVFCARRSPKRWSGTPRYA